jgi:hypothetical protein
LALLIWYSNCLRIRIGSHWKKKGSSNDEQKQKRWGTKKGMREKGSQNYSTTTQLFTHVGFGVELLKKFLLAVGKN